LTKIKYWKAVFYATKMGVIMKPFSLCGKTKTVLGKKNMLMKNV